MAKRNRWSKREYQQHIFQLGRGKPGRADDAGEVASKNWWNANQDSMSHMYEQEEIDINEAKDANGEAYQQFWGGDKADRERYRADKQAELKKQFRANLAKHPAFKDKTRKELGDIADAYLSGDDFDKPDARETAAALKEVADYTTGDGEVSMSDERTWRKNYPRNTPTETKKPSAAGPIETGNPPTLNNGQPKPQTAAAATPATGTAPLKPRPSEPVADVQTAGSRYNAVGQRASDTGVRVNGAPVQIGDTATRDNLRSGQSASTAADTVRAQEALRDARGERRTDTSRYLDAQEKREADFARMEARAKARNEALDRKFAAERQARMDKRYESLALNNDADWKNLAREGSNDLDYSDEKNANAKNARDARIKDLQDRFTKMGERSATNLFYQYDPNRQKDLAQLKNLFQQGVDAGNLTDKQIAAVEKKLSGWQSGAERRKSQFDAQEEMRQAEHVADLRRQYGMGDSTVFSKEDVLNFHEGQQKGRQKAILEGMDKPGADQAQAWSQLMAAGVDPEATFKRSLENNRRNLYMDELAGIMRGDGSDAQKAGLRDDLRRRYIVDQLRADNGMEGLAGSPRAIAEAGAAARQKQTVAGLDTTLPVRPRTDQEVATSRMMSPTMPAMAVEVPESLSSVNPLTEAEAQADALTARKKETEEQVQQLARGGRVLQPRKRR